VKVRQRSGRGTTGPVNVFDQFGQSEMAHDNSLPTLPLTLVVAKEATLSSPYGD
jgi:hypothetical protein